MREVREGNCMNTKIALHISLGKGSIWTQGNSNVECKDEGVWAHVLPVLDLLQANLNNICLTLKHSIKDLSILIFAYFSTGPIPDGLSIAAAALAALWLLQAVHFAWWLPCRLQDKALFQANYWALVTRFTSQIQSAYRLMCNLTWW